MQHNEHTGKHTKKTASKQAKSEMHSGHGSNGKHKSHHAQMAADFRRRFWISLVLTIPILILSPLIQEFLNLTNAMAFTGDKYILWALSTSVFVYGGFPFLKGFFNEAKSKSPGMMTLIALAVGVAYIYSSAVVFGLSGKFFFWELATLIDVMLLGHWLEMKSVMSASSALEELARLMPNQAHKVLSGNKTRDVALDELEAGDKVLVKPGEKVPADGRVLEGQSAVNEAMLTGESSPVAKTGGSQVIGGSVNGEGSLTVEIYKTGSESYLSQMTELVKQAQASKSRSQNLADRAAFWLTLVAIGAGTLTLVLWLTVFDREFVFSLERMVTVMVITCPHALGLAVPLVTAVSTALSARNGLLIKDRNNFEKARRTQAVLFDKTGTLTKGEFGITDIIVLAGDMKEEEILKYAASVESHSQHPIAKGISAGAKSTFQVKDFNSIPGKGAKGRIEGKDVLVVSPGYLEENNIQVANDTVKKLLSQGKTVVFLLVEGKLQGAIALADIIRPESSRAINRLKKMGIRCIMITGDNEKVAEWVANEVGLDEYFAEVLPGEKADKVREVQSRGLVVAMTGDGVNDAPALAQADVGIAIGTGTDVAAATADVILVKSNPQDVVSVIELSRSTYIKMLQNLGWATGYNVIAIPLAAGALYSLGILLSPAIGAALMSISTVIVAINARFLKAPSKH